MDKNFLDNTSKSQKTLAKTMKWDYITWKHFHTTKEIKKNKKTTYRMGENI
jgi:hypothetical protein